MGSTTDGIIAAAAKGSVKSKQPTLAQALEGKILSGKYRINKMIGEGGMGAVFEAVHTSLGNVVAVKVLPPPKSSDSEEELGSSLSRFEREGMAAARVHSDNVVRVTDSDYDADLNIHYIVMEYVDGISLKDLLTERRRLTLAETVDILRQTLSALKAIHASGVIHRDLKPSNILLTQVNGRRLVKVFDFGISKIDADDATLTATGVMVGTLPYMPPEMFQAKKADARSDLYTLGVIAYEMLTGSQPFRGTPESIMNGHLTKEPGTLRQRVLGKGGEQVFPASIEAFVAKALAKDRNKRHFSAIEMLQALNACRLTTGSATKTVVVVASLLCLGVAASYTHKNGMLQSFVDSMMAVPGPEPVTSAPPALPAVAASVPTEVSTEAAEPLGPPPILQRMPTLASALAHLNARKYDEAAREFEALLKQRPQDPTLLFHLGQAYVPQPKMARKATKAFNAYLATPGKKDPAKVLHAKGWISMHQK